MEGIDFVAADEAGIDGTLMELLRTIPKERWFDVDDSYSLWTLLHFACQGDNTRAVVALIEHGLDKEARSVDGETPIQVATRMCEPGPLEMLIRLGANVHVRDLNGSGLWDDVLNAWDEWREQSALDCARILFMNRVRPRRGQKNRCAYPVVLRTLERGIDLCRATTVAILRVKRAGGLWRWDKFLLALIARHVWATRGEEWAK